MAENTSSYNMADYNRGGYIAFMFSMAVTVAFFIYIAFIHPGVDLKEVEEQIKKEAQVATPASPEAASDAAAPAAAEPAPETTAEEPKK
jgi:hypothetical protein